MKQDAAVIRVYKRAGRWRIQGAPGSFDTQREAMAVALVIGEIDRLSLVIVELRAQAFLTEKRHREDLQQIEDMRLNALEKAEGLIADKYDDQIVLLVDALERKQARIARLEKQLREMSRRVEVLDSVFKANPQLLAAQVPVQ